MALDDGGALTRNHWGTNPVSLACENVPRDRRRTCGIASVDRKRLHFH
jgi:hypothetical protein